MELRLRPERAADAAAIDALIRAAFLHAPHSDHSEHRIVAALRAAGQLSVSLMAEDAAGIAGHVAVSPVTISDATPGWYGLGPISVAPARQGRGIGAQLMRAALHSLRERGAAGCVVLGDPRYYARFGFVADARLRFPGVPAEYFQALHWQGATPAGDVRYAAAFYAGG